MIRLNDLENKYKVAGERLLDLESCLPEGFREQMRTLKAEIDTLQARLSSCNTAGVNTPVEAKALANAYSELLSNKTDDELLERDTIEQYITDIQLQYVFQRTGSKIFGAIDAITIRSSLGSDALEKTTVCRYSPEGKSCSLKIKKRVPLPILFFESSKPLKYRPMI